MRRKPGPTIGIKGQRTRFRYILVRLFRSAQTSIQALLCLLEMHVGTAMTPLKTLAAAGAIAFALTTVADSAFARPGGAGSGGRGGGYHGGGGYRGGGHYHGGHRHYYRGSIGFWGGGFWGPGYWGAGYWPGYWGASYWGPGWGYYGAPAVAYTPFVTQERVWVESDAAGATPPPAAAPVTNPNTQQWWYWCASSRGYYPYVNSCAEGWQRVAPQPTPSTQ